MNVFLLGSQERLKIWRCFRNNLKNLPESEQLEATLKWWEQSPVCHWTMNYDDSKSWPSPWELLFQKELCTTAIAHGIVQTLVIAGWNPDRIQLAYVRSSLGNSENMLVIIDNSAVFNDSLNEIVQMQTIEDQCLFLTKYQVTKSGYIKI